MFFPFSLFLSLIHIQNESHHKVLIMELCTGGSLFNILDDPVNYYGLDEKEFIAVLKHLGRHFEHLVILNSQFRIESSCWHEASSRQQYHPSRFKTWKHYEVYR